MAYLIHLGYIITLAAFLARDILLLRGLLVVAQIIVATYALNLRVWPIAGWNSLFAVINIVWVVLILRDRRRVQLPAELQPMYERHFAALTPREFLRLWSLGRRETIRDGRLTSTGANPDWLYFLLKGQVRVSRGQATVTTLPAGYFVAEMSLLTGHPANADVEPVGEVEVMRWPARDLHALRGRSPALWIKIQSVIGFDLVEKIRRGDERLATQGAS
jgi:CRP-like cAMP-binding protein